MLVIEDVTIGGQAGPGTSTRLRMLVFLTTRLYRDRLHWDCDLAAYRFVQGNSCTFEGLRPHSTYRAIVASVTKGGNTGSDRAIFTTLAK